MKKLTSYIKNSNVLKLSKDDKETLIALDSEFGDLICTYREDRNWKDVLNVDEEYEKFINARQRGVKYYPQLKMNPNKFSENGLLQRMETLRNKFMNFNCFLSNSTSQFVSLVIALIVSELSFSFQIGSLLFVHVVDL